VKSVRLDGNLEARLEAASRLLGKSQSDVIREAVGRYCDSVSEDRLDLKLAPYIGVIHAGIRHISDTAEDFTQMLIEDHKKMRRRNVGTG
jgi:predicted DNA-binding protein